MACRVEEDDLGNDQEQSQAVQDPQQVDYDFVEEPSQDFFCPVTLELLIEPHLTMCCGNHLSQEAANRLQRDGKPCPMCKEPLNAVPNKHFKRKINDIKVRCPHKKSSCEWVGGVNEVKQHSDSCPKRPWQCLYCEFASTYDIGISKHVPKCTKYPVVCPNSCEMVSVPRCDLEAHLMVCPLQPVACEYAEVGCDVKVPRRDLAHHMEESQQQHLLSATLLNLRMTRENTEEKNRLLRMIEENKAEIKEKDKVITDLQAQLRQVKERTEKSIRDKDTEITEKTQHYAKKEAEFQKELALKDQKTKVRDEKINDLQKQLEQVQEQADENMKKKDAENTQQLKKKETECQKELAIRDQHIKQRDVVIKEKDKVIADLQKELKRVQGSLEEKIANLQQQVVKYGEDTREHLKQHDKNVEHFMFCQFSKFNFSYIQQGFTLHEFTLTEFKKCQAQGFSYGNWFSEPFYSHPGGYKFKLNVETNGYGADRGVFMRVWFYLLEGDHDDKLDWPVTVTAHVQLLNQLGDHNHHERTCTGGTWDKGRCLAYGCIDRFIKHTNLELNTTKNTQYLKNDCLQLRVYFKATKK